MLGFLVSENKWLRELDSFGLKMLFDKASA